jgi:hypothetical protein
MLQDLWHFNESKADNLHLTPRSNACGIYDTVMATDYKIQLDSFIKNIIRTYNWYTHSALW